MEREGEGEGKRGRERGRGSVLRLITFFRQVNYAQPIQHNKQWQAAVGAEGALPGAGSGAGFGAGAGPVASALLLLSCFNLQVPTPLAVVLLINSVVRSSN